jgi:hypothetical protein
MVRNCRVRLETTDAQTLVHSRESTARLADRRFGGMVLVDYLFNLFAASSFETFGRLSVLTVLDRVKKDKGLFPDVAPRLCCQLRAEAPPTRRLTPEWTRRRGSALAEAAR